MMNFRTIKDNVIALLGAAEAGRYRTIGFQRQVTSAEEALGNGRTVSVFYRKGEFPKSSGRPGGPVQHVITYAVELAASAAALADLSVLESDASTPAEKAAALTAMKEAAYEADKSFDELAEIIYQILMDGRNRNLGCSFNVANRWISDIVKDEPLPQGELVTLTGAMALTCKIDESVPGETPTTPAETKLDATVQSTRDDTETGISDSGVIITKTV